ncbi:LLM class flavin-dependent oxidoreductase [Dactylosporangium sp. CA-092794]|uniref:LLM class flavin-dependent oxidoreductase n=1 Tax=Dactylosporangium sp. CA-092794 TaxID=3239929 RepID=UPI003D8F97FB
MTARSLALHEPLTATEIVELAVLAEGLGYDRIWFGEVRGPDPFVCAAAVAMRTRRVELGTSIASYFARSPFSLAVSATSVADLSGRTFRLGIGPGGKGLVENIHQREFGKPLEAGLAAIQAIRDGLGDGGPRSRVRWQREVDVRVYLAALGPKMRHAAYQHADGFIAPFETPEYVRAVDKERQEVPSSAEHCVRLLVAVTDDVRPARERMRETIRFYLDSPHYRRHFAAQGFASEVADYLAASARGERAGQLAAVSDALVDAMLVCGSAGHCAGRIAEYLDSGAGDLMVSPFSELGPAVVAATVTALAPNR